MKTLRTIAAVVLAAFMVLGPSMAFAAGETVTASTNAGTYSGQATIQVSGTVTPAPTTSSTAVVVTTKGPQGVVDTGTANVATSTGAYTYTFVSGGSPNWVPGTYVVNATYGGPGGSGSATTTFTYTTSVGQVLTGGGSTAVTVQVAASTPVLAGQQEVVSILTSFAANGSLAAATFQTIHFSTPAGALVTLCSSAGQTGCTGTFTTIHKGFYTISFSAPSGAGGYFVHAWTNGPVAGSVSSGQGQGLAEFTVQTASTADVATALTAINSQLAVLTTGYSTMNTALQTIQQNTAGYTSQLNTISQGVTGLTSTLAGIASNIKDINSIGGQITSMNNAINNNQTYVLVVAALAAITLVLELAILVRKLS